MQDVARTRIAPLSAAAPRRAPMFEGRGGKGTGAMLLAATLASAGPVAADTEARPVVAPEARPVVVPEARPVVVPEARPVVVPNAESFAMTATGSGRSYRIFLARPTRPCAEGGCPVLYFLDGNATFATAAEALRLQTRTATSLEPAAVVAIGTDTDQPFDITARHFDYTTPADPAVLRKRGNGAPYPPLGGADAFLDFIADDLMPEIGRRLPADPERAALVGHSLGGYLTLHALLTRPRLFATYVAGSPSIWWNEEEIVGRAEAFAATAPDLAGRRLFVGAGGDEPSGMVEGAARIAAILAPLGAHGLTLSHQTFAGESHIAVLPALISRSFRLALRQPAGTE